MSKKQKIMLIVWWSVAVAGIVAGIVMLSIGLRAIITAFLDTVFAPLTGDSSANIYDFSVDPQMMTLSIAGLCCLVVGAIAFLVASIMRKEFGRSARADRDAQIQVQSILRDMGLETAKTAKPAADRYCVRCGKPIEKADYEYCPYCGAKAVQPEPTEEEQKTPAARKCIYCGQELQNEEKECPTCGHKVKHE